MLGARSPPRQLRKGARSPGRPRRGFFFRPVALKLFSVGWLLTGKWWMGGLLAVIEPACNTVVFHFHEKLWKRIEARRALAAGPVTR